MKKEEKLHHIIHTKTPRLIQRNYIKIMKTKTVLKVALTSATVMAHPDVEMIFKEKVKEAVVVINPDSFRTFERHVG